MALTDRNISDLPLGTCTYLDLGNLCFFNVTAAGTLNRDGKAGWSGQPGGSWHCKQAMEAVVADVMAAKQRHPTLKVYYELWDVTPAYGDAPSGHTFVRIFSNGTLLERFVSDRKRAIMTVCARKRPPPISSMADNCALYAVASFVHANRAAVDGFNIDWELTLDASNEQDVAARTGLTTFLRRLKETTSLGVSFDIGALDGFKNIAEVDQIQPYIDHLEIMSYFTNLTAPLNAAEHKIPSNGGSVLQDIETLIAPPNNYRRDQIVIGVGLSSDSVMNVSLVGRDNASSCAYWGWGCERPADGVKDEPPTTGGPHATMGGTDSIGTPGRRTWDQVKQDVEAGRGFRGQSGLHQGFAHWYFFPNADNITWGELTWWNDISDFDYFTSFVSEHDLGGVFSWIATSDAPDWRVHKYINHALQHEHNSEAA